jgi:predicted nucleic acid-binding protein
VVIEKKAYRAPPIVLDTNVLVAGACRRRESLAYRVLMGVLTREIPLALTTPIALEYLDVLQRPRISALTKLDHSQSSDLVTALIALSYEVQTRFSWRPNLTDESDNKFVEAAIHTAAIIVTYNSSHYTSGDLPRHGWGVMTPQELVARYL